MRQDKLIHYVIRVIPAAIFTQSLYFKFLSAPESVYIFTKVGMEPWGRYLTGLAELCCVVMFFVPSLSWLGAFLAIDVMIGAIFSHLTLLGVEVQGDRGLLFGLSLAVFACSIVILHQERHSVPVIGPLLKRMDNIAKAYDADFEPSFGHRLPIVIILSFALLCVLGIAAQVLSIDQILASPLVDAAKIHVAQWSYFLTLLIVFVTFLITVFVVSVFERPLHELILVCQKIATGDRATRARLPLSSEFGILSASMNQMLEELQTNEAKLSENHLNIQRLLRVVVHDVANPLMVIRSLSDLALSNASVQSDSAQVKHWTRVSDASKKIEGIIRSTRDFEAVRSGVKKLELKKHSVLKCIESVVDTFRERLAQKSVTVFLQNNSGHDHPEILIEENLFNSSVVSNLLSNAIKFSPEGSEIEIKIELLPATDSSTRLALTIADNGVGLPPEMREKFNLGQNVQSRVGTSGEQGTGFGLDIARAIVKSMNGELMIKSQTAAESPNEHGTSVTLVFPFAATSH